MKLLNKIYSLVLENYPNGLSSVDELSPTSVSSLDVKRERSCVNSFAKSDPDGLQSESIFGCETDLGGDAQ